MHIEHGKVGKFYANINLALEKELPGPEEGESLEAYARHAIHYRDSLQKAIEWKRDSNPDLTASVEQLIANLQQGYEKERRVRLDETGKEKS